MNEEYDIRIWQDNIYAIYKRYDSDDDIDDYNSPLFKGTIEEINAWLELHKKGFDL